MFKQKNENDDVDIGVLDDHKPSLKDSEAEWINAVLKKGTISDKLAAHTILIHESRNWNSLAALIDMVDPRKCRRQCVMAMNTLKELFLESLNIKSNKNATLDEEDKKKIKFYYAKFIDQMHLVAFDNLEETRRKAIFILSALLLKHDDNKQYIVEKLIDKLCDKIPKLAATAANLITRAVNGEKKDLRNHLVKCIQRFLKKPNLEPKPKFYAIALLSRIMLYRNQHDVANSIVEIYLSVFQKMVEDKDFDSRLMSTIFIGLHRVYPYSQLSNDVFEQHLQTLYTLVHHVNYKESILALVLIKNIVKKRAKALKSPVEDRYYNVLFKQLLRPELQKCSRMEQFCDLTLSLINEDPILERKVAFVKRMLQVAVYSKPHLTFILLHSLTKIKGFNTLFNLNNDDKEDIKSDEESEQESEGDSGASNGDAEEANITSSWVHIKKNPKGNVYDPLARNPRFANAKKSRLYELYLLLSHFHPEISTLAQQVIDGKPPSEGLSVEQFSYVSCMNKFLLANSSADDTHLDNKNNKNDPAANVNGSKHHIHSKPVFASASRGQKRKKNRRLTKRKKNRLVSAYNQKQQNGNH